MFKPVLVTAGIASASAFAPLSVPAATGLASRRPALAGMRMQSNIAEKSLLTPETFNRLDADKSGKLDQQELSAVFADPEEAAAFLQRGDVNGDGEIDYAEFERLMRIAANGEEAGGNLDVRNAMKAGLCKPQSVLADCVMVGNKGFDPLNLASDLQKLNNYRDSELKHGRLAMLAALGWPTAELLHPYIAKAYNYPDLLAAAGKAPSVLNGGLVQAMNPILFTAIVMLSATVEGYALKFNTPAKVPGDLGFDPLCLYYGKSEPAKRDLELKELNNGRLAMLAITGYAAQEFVTKLPVSKF